MPFECQICQSIDGETFDVQEQMFGLRDVFQYFECHGCGCLQLVTPPSEMSKYYPPDKYYSLRQQTTPVASQPAGLIAGVRKWIKRQRDRAILFQQGGLFGRLACKRPNPGIEDVRRWLAPTTIRSFDAPILDVGCGQGELLHRFADLGFRSLTGFDPFLDKNVCAGPVRLINTALADLPQNAFPLVMMHHALEHVPNQFRVLEEVSRLLTADGICLIRIPIKSGGPWARYGCNWAEIDAPRHFFLHTEYSLSLAAQRAGLSLIKIEYEAELFPYLASELYCRGLPLYDPDKNLDERSQEIFSPAELQQIAVWAQLENVPGRASRAAFYLAKLNDSTLPVSFIDLQENMTITTVGDRHSDGIRQESSPTEDVDA